MPSRNIVKEYGAGNYYHVYNRGVNKQPIFIDEVDYATFLGLLKRYLSPETTTDSYGRAVVNYSEQVELVSYCLMPNHYHLLFYLIEDQGIELCMRSTMTAYSMYFNKRHGRVGSLFQNHFLASRVSDDAYYWHVSRYIHLNPLDIGKDPFTYPYSSLQHFLGKKRSTWVHPECYVTNEQEAIAYGKFVKDYQDAHRELKIIKHLLANTLY
jgi:putative transposase